MSTTLKVGESIQLPKPEKYSSTNAEIVTVSASGLVTAHAAGNANVRAINSFVVLPADSAPPPPTPEPTPDSAPPPAPGTNEPTGLTLITNRGFDALDEMGWVDEGSGQIVSDATSLEPPMKILRTTLPAGFHAGSGSAWGDLKFAPVRTLYARYRARLSLNWVGGDAGIDKQFYVYTDKGVPSLVFAAGGGGSAPKYPLMEGQDIVKGGIGTYPHDPDFVPNLVRGAVISRGEWYRIEALLVGNTLGQSDGSFDIYLNGLHVTSYKGIQFVSGDCKWGLFHYTNIWTGVSSKVKAAQTLDFDNIYLSGK